MKLISIDPPPPPPQPTVHLELTLNEALLIRGVIGGTAGTQREQALKMSDAAGLLTSQEQNAAAASLIQGLNEVLNFARERAVDQAISK